MQEAGWAPGAVGTGAENLAPTGIRSPDRPARSESLYRMSYRSPRRNEKSTELFLRKAGFVFHVPAGTNKGA